MFKNKMKFEIEKFNFILEPINNKRHVALST